MPQSITSFIYAKEYGLHAEVLSTAYVISILINLFHFILIFQLNFGIHFHLLMARRVIFGMMVSLPVLIAYYAVLEFVH